MSEHAELSASGSSMWLHCAGSRFANKDRKDKGSVYAAEGTMAHGYGEKALVDDVDPHDLAKGEMGEHVATYVDYVRSIPGRKFYELKVHFDTWVPEGFGTCDAISIDGSTMHVMDLKYGKGVKVFAESNSQLMLYALGAYTHFEMIQDIKEVNLHVIQPRLDHIDVWTISVEDLLRWAGWVRERAEIAMRDDAPRTPGEKQCQWCRAKGDCQALYEHTTNIIGQNFEDLSEMNTGNMSDADVRKVLENASLIKAFLSAVEDHVFDMLSNGQPFDGFKLVEGRSLRKWHDEKQAAEKLEEILGEDAWERSLLSPAKAEKALGKKRRDVLSELVNKPAGKPTLVPASDKRSTIQQDLVKQFKQLN